MFAQRVRLSAPRALRIRSPLLYPQARFQSSSTGGSSSAITHIAAGIAGGLMGTAIYSAIYSYTPAGQTASKLNQAAVEVNKQYKIAADKLQSNAPNADQAIKSIKEFAYSYIGWIPGSRAYLDSVFEDVDLIREKHQEEADKVAKDAYNKLQKVSQKEISTETISQIYSIIADLSHEVADLSGDAISDILDNHPQFKEKLSGNVDKLKQMGDRLGPEVKKQVDDTWKDVRDIFSGGFGAANFAKAKKLIDDRVEQIQKIGDHAWQTTMKELQPYLEKSPNAKKLIEENEDILRKGDLKSLFEKARSAVKSGDTSKLEKYLHDSLEKAKSKTSQVTSGWDLEGYFRQIPGGAEALPRLQAIESFAKEHKEDGEKLWKETTEELVEVIKNKAGKAEEMVKSAEQEKNKEAK